jgi:hypothetical protein
VRGPIKVVWANAQRVCPELRTLRSRAAGFTHHHASRCQDVTADSPPLAELDALLPSVLNRAFAGEL